MVKVDGVNRVTMKQKDSYVLFVKEPEVFSSPQNPNSFIIFGELTFEDQDKKLTQDTIAALKKEGEKLKTVTEKKKNQKSKLFQKEKNLVKRDLKKKLLKLL